MTRFLQDFLVRQISQLWDFEAIALAQKIQYVPILAPLSPQPISTAMARQNSGKIPVLLLHGFDSSLLEFYRLFPCLVARLSENYQIWSIDLLGFGFTERKPDLNYTPDTIKAHLYAFWKVLIQQPMILLGVSMGGATAIDFALTYPEAVSQLILVNSVGYSGSFSWGKLLLPPVDALAVEFWKQRKLQALNWGKFFGMSGAESTALQSVSLHLEIPGWAEAMIAFTKSGGYFDLSQKIARITQPTLILWGDTDEMLGTKDAWKFQRDISNSQLFWIPNGGHTPHLKYPEYVARLISKFLDRN
ncbi:MAG: alpha/beta hydrolase [Oscillatoriales cyanobacterium RM2_1_1]|nr:alpha/beta hydrolase [Oscillatoriales cyanobacterium SM2_3_0]NJO45875.1 alpha/beta hydrolase [Oscillatoriales cyanobacterium RM2_1_1]